MKITGEPKFQGSGRVWGSNINSHFTNGDPGAEKSSGTGPGLQTTESPAEQGSEPREQGCGACTYSLN